MTFYWWVVALNVIQLAWKCIDLLSGAWQQKNHTQHIVFKAFGLIPILLLANAPDRVYAFLKHPDTDLSRYGEILNSFNSGIHIVLLLVSAIVALQLAWDIGTAIFERWRQRAQAN